MVIPADVEVSVVIVAEVNVALVSDRLLTVRLDTDRLVIAAEVEASVVTVPRSPSSLLPPANPC